MQDKLVFPKPSGQYKIGYFDDYIKYNSEYGDRYLGFRCFYPAINESKEQMTYIDSEMYKMFEALAPNSPISDLYKKYIKLKTNSYKCTNIIDAKHKVIIYSPGYNTVPWANLVQIEELVSHGYVVFAVARCGENFCTILGDKKESRKVELFGPFIEEVVKYMMESEEYTSDPMFVYNWSIEGIQKYLEKCVIATDRMELWSNDIIQIMNYAQEKVKDKQYFLFDKLDCNKFGAFGNSFGGTASVYASLIDERIGASINLDGWVYGGKLLKNKLKVPALVFSKSINHYLACYGTENSNIYSLVIKNTVNEYMSDFSVIGQDFVKNCYSFDNLIDGNMMSNILNDFIKASFDIHLLNCNKNLNIICQKYNDKIEFKKFEV